MARDWDLRGLREYEVEKPRPITARTQKSWGHDTERPPSDSVSGTGDSILEPNSNILQVNGLQYLSIVSLRGRFNCFFAGWITHELGGRSCDGLLALHEAHVYIGAFPSQISLY